MSKQLTKSGFIQCKASCHCQRVQLLVNVPVELTVNDCNCSICKKSGYLHLIVTKDDLQIVQGRDELTEYLFNTGAARHFFCRNCGIKSFYVPRSHPEGYSVNLNCVDLDSKIRVKVKRFDGQNWQQNIDELIDRE